MIKPVTEKDLVRRAIDLAAYTRREMEAAGVFITDFQAVARMFDVTVVRGELPKGKDGSYLKDERKIILNSSVTTPERINFSFCHEIMHVQIEDDGDFLSDFADAYRRPDEEAMEWLCNTGAAEILMPSDQIREYACSVALIPELCERFSASSIAIAFQMVNCATHECYLVIAEPTWIVDDQMLPMLPESILGGAQERLSIIYSSRSSAAKYSIKKLQILSTDHALYVALRQPGIPVKLDAKLPFASGNGWDVPCEILLYKGKVFALFNRTPPASPDQLVLL